VSPIAPETAAVPSAARPAPTVGSPASAAGLSAAAEGGRFEPRITAFVCNWCTYAGADLTGTSRIRYQPNVRVIRLPCTGRIDFMLVMTALAQGADGVIVSGCHPNDCHYTSGNYHARRRWMVFRDLLDFAGIDVRRIVFAWVSAAEGAKWAELVNQVTDEVRSLGPYRDLSRLADEGAE
jgi:coenzyme F420-reducing hydrogenase delta subunit